MAQSPGYWAFVRSESFDSRVWNAPGSPAGWFSPTCPTQVIQVQQIDVRVIKYVNSVPASCNYNKAALDQHRHEWTELQNTIAVGEAPKFTSTSKVVELINTTAPFGGSSLMCGFVAYDAPSNLGPYRDASLANSAALNRSGVGSSSTESNEGRPQAAQFKMPAHPWMGSGNNSGLIRFRVHVYTGTVWRSVDKIYQWRSNAPAPVSTSSAPPAARPALLPSGTYRIETAASGGQWIGTLRITVSGSRIQGQSEWDCCPGRRVDPLSGALTGNRIRFTRICTGQGFNQPCDQVYEGVIEDKSAHGTFTMNGPVVGTWKFVIR
jgi:hypothetical protein